MQAIFLAAGMGKRLHSDINKCMVEINGISLWNRVVAALKRAGIFKIVVVTGYHARELEAYIRDNTSGMEVCFVENEDYETTNNIWSFYLAKSYFGEDTILLESDLIYEENSIKGLCEFCEKDVAVVAKYEPWMDGTTVLLEGERISKIIPKKEIKEYDVNSLYKTVNIYKFSSAFLQNEYLPALERFIAEKGKNEYYEMVLKEMLDKKGSKLSGYQMRNKWYEIDTVEDLEIAKEIF